MISSDLEKLIVVDANVLLSIIAGKAASKALDFDLELYTTDFTWQEALQYLNAIAEYYKYDPAVLVENLELAGVDVVGRDFYKDQMKKAKKIMQDRDPDDVELAALALKCKAPVWSNDNHFKDFPTGRYTTAQLLKKLGV